MASPRVVTYLTEKAPQLVPRIQCLDDSGASVLDAAKCLNCRPEHVAKALTFAVKRKMTAQENNAAQRGGGKVPKEEPHPVVIVAAGDAKVSNTKFKAYFSQPPKMVKSDQLESAVGFPPGGVCPFGVCENVRVFLDVSLKRFETVYPACGNPHSALALTVDELEATADHFAGWVDVCQDWPETAAEGDTNIYKGSGSTGEKKKIENESEKVQ